jgi:hypothetical protein
MCEMHTVEMREGLAPGGGRPWLALDLNFLLQPCSGWIQHLSGFTAGVGYTYSIGLQGQKSMCSVRLQQEKYVQCQTAAFLHLEQGTTKYAILALPWLPSTKQKKENMDYI